MEEVAIILVFTYTSNLELYVNDVKYVNYLAANPFIQQMLKKLLQS